MRIIGVLAIVTILQFGSAVRARGEIGRGKDDPGRLRIYGDRRQQVSGIGQPRLDPGGA